MDPNIPLRLFWSAMKRADESESGTEEENDFLRTAVDYAADVFEWMAKGGYAPDWSKR
jgi:hypothetical protein